MPFPNPVSFTNSIDWTVGKHHLDDRVALINKDPKKDMSVTIEDTAPEDTLTRFGEVNKWVRDYELNIVYIGLASLRAIEYGRMISLNANSQYFSVALTMGIFWLTESILHTLQGLVKSNSTLTKAVYLLGSGVDLVINVATICLIHKGNTRSQALVIPFTLVVFDCMSLLNEAAFFTAFVFQNNIAKKTQNSRNPSDKALSTMQVSSLIIASAASIAGSAVTFGLVSTDSYNLTGKIIAVFSLTASVCVQCFTKAK